MKEQFLDNKEKPKNGWENETAERNEAVTKFLKNYFAQNIEERPHYDSVELQFSGIGPNVFPKIQEGEVPAQEIKVLYEKGKIVQLHAIFVLKDNERYDTTDVYFTGKALQDFLNQEEYHKKLRVRNSLAFLFFLL